MKIDAPYRCNVCKRPKGEGNKWLLMYNTFDCITTRWNEANAREDSDVLHICGAVCAGKVQAEWIAKQIADSQKGAVSVDS